MKKILALGSLAGGIYLLYLANQFYTIYNFTYKISKVVVKNLTLNSTSILLYVDIINKSSLSVTIYDQQYDVLVNGVKVSSVLLKDVIQLTQNSATSLPLDIAFSPMSILQTSAQNLTAILTDKSKVNIELKGTISVKWKSIDLKNIKVDITYTLQDLINMSKTPTV